MRVLKTLLRARRGLIKEQSLRAFIHAAVAITITLCAGSVNAVADNICESYKLRLGALISAKVAQVGLSRHRDEFECTALAVLEASQYGQFGNRTASISFIAYGKDADSFAKKEVEAVQKAAPANSADRSFALEPSFGEFGYSAVGGNPNSPASAFVFVGHNSRMVVKVRVFQGSGTVKISSDEIALARKLLIQERHNTHVFKDEFSRFDKGECLSLTCPGSPSTGKP